MIDKDKMIEIERLEHKYLMKYYYFLKFALDEILYGFNTKNKIKGDWIEQWQRDLAEGENKGISDFAVGAERIVYALLNGKGIGQPNSSPVGSDLFFEVSDAFIHIDLKTVQTNNIGDYIGKIFVGNNQNSFRTILNGKIYEEASLPFEYTITDTERTITKPCLTYFITILYEAENLDVLNINLLCLPNGILEPEYTSEILQAGKIRYPKGHIKRDTHAKSVRFNWEKCTEFKLLEDVKDKRYQCVYFDKRKLEEIKNNNSHVTDTHFRKLVSLLEVEV